MIRRSSRLTGGRLIRACLLATALSVPVGAALAANQPSAPATAPTADTLSPAQIDLRWEKRGAKHVSDVAAELRQVEQGDGQGPFRPDWASLKNYQVPQWYADAKFGVFIHWGLYSVPAFGSEWYSRLMYTKGTKEYDHHIKTFGSQDKFGYKDFIPLFKAEKYDPRAWAALFRAAGAQYVVPVAEHHDGFALYDTKLSDWSAVRMGPKRDLIGDLARAVRAQGLHLGLSSHRAEHDWFFDEGRKIPSDVNDPRYADFYGPAQLRVKEKGSDDADVFGDFTPVSQAWLSDWLARSAELVDLYHPDLIYFDWWIGHPAFRGTLPKFLAYYYNSQAKLGGSAIVNYKIGAFPEGAGVLDIERGQLPGIQPRVWQTCTSISNDSWGYVENDTYKSPQALIHLLADVVSKNGNLLLNIGPRADGSIPQGAQDTLMAMGGWLTVNGEAIYGTRPWRQFGEGPTEVASGSFQETKTKPYTAQDFRFTTKGAALYAIELGWPAEGEAVIHSLKVEDKVKAVTLLGVGGGTLTFRQDADGLHLTLPQRPAGAIAAYVYRIEMQ
ncbi:alpha-L-fucosidase [Nitrospirillum viridazoti]|uniref:alpha-L-fucosidase n=1 Tax=Nitrospirillum viridazoti CBAmc TaxID=1441467 RepID=A0A248K2J6_9PROT|nr:alpha-L-fucosidase [Nitrospirillum amazonense]ASG25195.1 alpha-L-fucosidase [Nitrospirillum amazonense CBAmc]TWB29210.1 alpha-L-fucosidase [Nitrospirillum amazonense]